MIILIDPTSLKPGDIVIEIKDFEWHGCHCDVLVRVEREQ